MVNSLIGLSVEEHVSNLYVLISTLNANKLSSEFLFLWVCETEMFDME